MVPNMLFKIKNSERTTLVQFKGFLPPDLSLLILNSYANWTSVTECLRKSLRTSRAIIKSLGSKAAKTNTRP